MALNSEILPIRWIKSFSSRYVDSFQPYNIRESMPGMVCAMLYSTTVTRRDYACQGAGELHCLKRNY